VPGEVTAPCSESRVVPPFCGQNAEILSIETCGTYSDQSYRVFGCEAVEVMAPLTLQEWSQYQQDFAAVSKRSYLFWDVNAASIRISYRRFGASYWSLIQG